MDKKKLIEFINNNYEDDSIIAVSLLDCGDIEAWWTEQTGEEDVSRDRLEDFLKHLNNIKYASLWDWDFIEHVKDEYLGE